MRIYRWVTFAVLCSALCLFLVLGPVLLHDARALEAEEQRLLELISEYRQANGVSPLAASETLSLAAGRHSEDMTTYDFFSHTTEASSYYPVGSGHAERVAQEGYPANSYTAENIAWGQTTAEEVFEAWRTSEEHNANMLGANYTAAGIGHAGPYWTANFGSVGDAATPAPAPQKPAAAPQPQAEQPAERKADEQLKQAAATPAAKPAAAPQPKPQTSAEPPDAEPSSTGQIQPPQPQAEQLAERKAEGQAKQATAAPATKPAAEAAPRTSSSQAAEETASTEDAQPSGEEHASGEPDAGNATQTALAASVEQHAEGTSEASVTEAAPAEAAEAPATMESDTVEATTVEDETSSESALAQGSEEAATEEESSEQDSGTSQASTSGTSRNASGSAPKITELPRTGGTPLPLLGGGVLVLGGLLLYRVSRKQRSL